KSAAGFAHECGITYGRGSEDDPPDPLAEPHLHRREIANAPAELHRQGNRGEDRLHGACIHWLPGERPIEIHDVQPLKPLRLERPGLRSRIVIEHGRRVHLAELQADALAVLEVDGGEEDQCYVSM